ncbi:MULTISPECIES: elongation factor P 5-aminopentanone reductase [Anaerococcus]|jgi:3-oxoacyl-[acyl-carrier-protein] reductase|uniref:3-oxoacyl-ACP reductase n=1 Tax=Anaerococcus octavius TaxID=54007 RepID=A0A2I1M3K3_9FIRM|nr:MULTISPECIES: 3-oxoacyl-ACP reductase FabG [Anaerococcus]MDU0895071.1 3-oxoacyl-ACP reductase FabG [Anaerococcus sp.]MDU5534458.1 3-oxoacyl-ACP reductase FabG [Anaerococcus sp.]MDU7411493.1 3-oxoacyl-ACP reductase FabG [Anaerococcus sp.]PKZ14706.1 3-oxoacyl-ACP reductase [Anaerococcus octavius]SUU91981.1 3-oxoacyl-[acyl-carrier-protein] reductase FabG [Anaerococcus octavius]
MKTVLITGSSRGIGAAIARRLNDEYKIIINYNKSKDKAFALMEELRETNPNVIAIKANVSDESEVENMFSIAEKNFGHVDILINNAGISHFSLIQDIDFGTWKDVINTNLNSVFLNSKRAIPNMISKQYGVIINMSSIWGEIGASMETLYSASKGAINTFTKAMAKELAPSGIRVNAIAPGIVDTDMMRNDFSESELLDLKKEVDTNRFAKPEEIAGLVRYLISDEASYITGDIIHINGGFY